MAWFDAWDSFFHKRLGTDGCLFVGWLRMAFAFLFVADRLLLTLDLDKLLSPSRGLVPYWLGQTTVEPTMYTIFQLAPDNDAFLWAVHFIGIVQGILLFLGVAPRLQLLGVYINLISFQHHNQVIWDGEDMMFRAFCTNFLWMPLHTRTIYDGFGYRARGDGAKESTDTSWPMWPIRLFQIEMTFIYIGASLGKLQGTEHRLCFRSLLFCVVVFAHLILFQRLAFESSGSSWITGHAIHFISYSNDFYPGIFNPDFLFDRLGPLKLMTWSALFIEVSSWSLVWVPQLRIPIVVSMILLHVGIEITMNMHCFEWLAITGWLFFLLESDPKQTVKNRPVFRLWTDVLILSFIIWAFVYQVPPLEDIVPNAAGPFVRKIFDIQTRIEEALSPILHPIGAYQEMHTMYDGGWGWTRHEFRAEMYMKDGTVEEWKSPNWSAMSNLERKRSMRLMNYYATMEYAQGRLKVNLLRHLARELESKQTDFARITLYQIAEVAPDPPKDVGWFEPVRGVPDRSEWPVLSLYPPAPCEDRSMECEKIEEGARCGPRIAKDCPWSCGLCDDNESRDYVWAFYPGNESDDDYEDEEGEADDDDWSNEDWNSDHGNTEVHNQEL